MTEEQEKWYARETAAFRAWWEAGGEKTYSETPTMAAGAGWLKRAEAASSEIGAPTWTAIDQCAALAVELRTFTELLPYMEHLDEDKVIVPVKSLQKLREDSLALANALLEARAAPQVRKDITKGSGTPRSPAVAASSCDKSLRQSLADDIERHGLKGYVLNGHYLGNVQVMILEALRAAPSAIGAPTLPKSNDGKEQTAFELWAKGAGFDMTQHPLHWLFLDKRTYAAREGWRSALEYVEKVMASTDGKGDSNG